MDINVNVQVSGTVKVVLSSLLAQQELTGALTGTSQAAAPEPVQELKRKAEPEPVKEVKKAPVKKAKAAKEDKPEQPIEAELVEDAQDEVISGDELVTIRKKVTDFIHKDAANKDKVRDKLVELGAKEHRVSGLTKAMLPDFEAFLQA